MRRGCVSRAVWFRLITQQVGTEADTNCEREADVARERTRANNGAQRCPASVCVCVCCVSDALEKM